MEKLIGALVVILAAGLTPAGCASGGNPSTEPGGDATARLEPGDHAFRLVVEGRDRLYLVRVPPRSSVTDPAPVLVALHGGGGNPEQFRASAGLDAVADREGIVVAYPGGTGRRSRTLTWNAGPGCCGYARDEGIDDVRFLVALLDDLGGRHPIDPERVFVTGHSNGSMMAYRLAAERPDRIAAAVGVAGTMQLPDVAPSGPVPVLHVHSEDDPRAFYAGGERRGRLHPPVSAMLERWAAANGCQGQPSVIEERHGAEGGPDEGQTASLLRWSCTRARLEHWRLTGAGHAWPGNRVPRLRERIVGPSTEMILAAEEIWRFVEPLAR